MYKLVKITQINVRDNLERVNQKILCRSIRGIRRDFVLGYVSLKNSLMFDRIKIACYLNYWKIEELFRRKQINNHLFCFKRTIKVLSKSIYCIDLDERNKFFKSGF